VSECVPDSADLLIKLSGVFIDLIARWRNGVLERIYRGVLQAGMTNLEGVSRFCSRGEHPKSMRTCSEATSMQVPDMGRYIVL
jgi:hypothetical protein